MAHGVLDEAAHPTEAPVEVADREPDRRRGQEHQESELPVDPRIQASRPITARVSVTSTGQGPVRGLGDPIGVESELRHEPRHGRPVRPPDRQCEKLLEHEQAEIEEHSLGNDREGGRARPVGDGPRRRRQRTSRTVRPPTT